MGNENRGFPVAESHIYKQKDNTSVTELKLVKRRLASFHSFSCFFGQAKRISRQQFMLRWQIYILWKL